MAMKWYAVQVYSGFEKSVQRALEERVSRSTLQDKFGQILVPVEEVVEMNGGQGWARLVPLARALNVLSPGRARERSERRNYVPGHH